MTHHTLKCFLAVLIGLLGSQIVSAQKQDESADNSKAAVDPRFTKLRNLNSDFTWHAPKSLADWEKRAPILRRQIQLSTGLWPMPDHSEPPKAIVHGRVEREDFTVDRVILETMPGVYLTGSLFKPKNKSGKLPVVLTPHGHWYNGRFFREGDGQFKANMKNGAEEFESAGRHPLQAICVHLARMGCIAFFYDTLGNADNQQVSMNIGHNFDFANNKPLPDHDGKWGMYSPKAENRMESIMGLQTWNSIRALDFVSNLPDVDTKRIGVTGGSGGGTQTFILCAIDQRPAAAFPAVMVSAEMQGGCTCENACYLRIGTSNIEIAALTAPRPMGMTAARDWTQNMAKNGFPDLQDLYNLYGKKDLVKLFPFLKYGHNYNSHSRHAMYAFFNEHLKIGATDEQLKEQDFKPLTIKELTVYNDEHPKPKTGAEAEYGVLKSMTEQVDKTMAPIFNVTDKKSFEKFEEVVGGAWETMIGKPDWKNDNVKIKLQDLKVPPESVSRMFSVVNNTTTDRSHTISKVVGGKADGKKHVIQLVHSGSRSEFDQIAHQIAKSGSVVWPLRFVQGDEANEPEVKMFENNHDFAPFTFGYNPTRFAYRVQDVLTLILAIEKQYPDAKISIWAEPGTGHFAAAACALAKGKIDRAVIFTDGFRFDDVKSITSPDFQPGATKYGDLAGLIALAAPTSMYVVDSKIEEETKNGASSFDLVKKCYQAAAKNGEKQFEITKPAKDLEKTRAEALTWLISK